MFGNIFHLTGELFRGHGRKERITVIIDAVIEQNLDIPKLLFLHVWKNNLSFGPFFWFKAGRQEIQNLQRA